MLERSRILSLREMLESGTDTEGSLNTAPVHDGEQAYISTFAINGKKNDVVCDKTLDFFFFPAITCFTLPAH